MISTPKIKSVVAREILDSRGNPTVEADVVTDSGVFISSVPSGASSGSHEALELRDKDTKRYNGKGVLTAVKNVNSIISKKLVGHDCTKQEEIDNLMMELDGTENKSKLGANAILAVSMSVCKAGSASLGLPLYSYIGNLFGTREYVLPVPQMNVINGGAHAGMENDIQEHMIMPIGAKSFGEALRMGCETYQNLKALLKKRFGQPATLIADEGGFAPPFNSVEERLEMITKAIENSGYSKEIVLAIDSAASEFYNDGVYTIRGKRYSSGEMVDFYEQLTKTFRLVSIEDGLAEDDWDGWAELTKKLGGRIQIVGDDLLVTNVSRIKNAIELKAINSALIKLNQIGTVTETLNAIRLAKTNKFTSVVSHRSGETEDSFISDLVVGVAAGQSKFGAPARSDRNAKYNQLLRIEEALGSKAKYAGKNFRGF